jgi:hypothetical protein
VRAAAAAAAARHPPTRAAVRSRATMPRTLALHGALACRAAGGGEVCACVVCAQAVAGAFTPALRWRNRPS